MKEIIVLIGMIILGTLVFNQIIGEESKSLKNSSEKMMEQSVIQYINGD